jgi:hypothetical protein
MQDKLRELNFNDLLTLDTNIKEYTFEKYVNNGRQHPRITKVCTRCEQMNVPTCPADPAFKLSAMGHGAASDDILIATGQQHIDTSTWKKQGVMFILENPGPVAPFYKPPVASNGFTKCPTHVWYWVHQSNPQKCEYPTHFQGKEYDEFFCSVMFTFKLMNLYITDIIKCGMNDMKGNFKPIFSAKGQTFYKIKCIKNCLKHYFFKEVKLVDPRVIFCLGHGAEKIILQLQDRIENCLQHGITVKYLWHPQARYSANEFQAHYLTGITEGLCTAGIISENEKKEYLKGLILTSIPQTIPVPQINMPQGNNVNSKLAAIKQHFEKNGYSIIWPKNKNYMYENTPNPVYFWVRCDNNGIITIKWGNGGRQPKTFNKIWFDTRNREICKLYPNSMVTIGIKNSDWIWLPIPVDQKDYLNSLLVIVQRTKDIMLK